LLCNTVSSSSKYKKAEKLGIPIITEEELANILEG
jgi:NAD-dependent DNA ligase